MKITKEEAKKKYQDGEIQIYYNTESRGLLFKEITNMNTFGTLNKFYKYEYGGQSNPFYKKPIVKISEIEEEVNQVEGLNTPSHYTNDKGSLYKIALERGWNAYQFDIVKRIDRADKKGEFDSDLEKSINVIKLWKEESKCQQ